MTSDADSLVWVAVEPERTCDTINQAALARWEAEQVAREVIGDEAVEKALAEGRRMTLDEAVEYATRLLTD